VIHTSGDDLWQRISRAIKALPKERQAAAFNRLAEVCIKYRDGKINHDAFVAGLLPKSLFLPQEIKVLDAQGVLANVGEA
jgi:hypothetical protein